MFLDLVLGIPIIFFSASGLVDVVIEEDAASGKLEPKSRLSKSPFKWITLVVGIGLFVSGIILREQDGAATIRYLGIVIASLASPAFTGIAGHFIH